MSCSSSAGGSTEDLKYQYFHCSCGRKAVVKIVESDKPSKGKLYFVCATRSCEFFSWCNPTRRIRQNYTSDLNVTRRDIFSGESSIDSSEVEGLRMDGGLYLRKMKNIEESLGVMKICVGACFAISVLSFLILMFN